MVRPLPVEFPEALYHVTSRGGRREKIFDDDRERTIFLEIFASVAERYYWLCHGYCLMDNHYHLLIETPEGNLSSGMRQLNGVYTQRYNRTHRTVGHLLQGRREKGRIIYDSRPERNL